MNLRGGDMGEVGEKKGWDGKSDVTILITVVNQNRYFSVVKIFQELFLQSSLPQNVLRKLLYKQILKEGKARYGSTHFTSSTCG